MNKVLVILIGVVLVLSACGGAESRKEKYLQSANGHYHDNDCKKAKLDYKNALQIDPKTVDALIGLSRCAVEEKEWKNAYRYLLTALDTDPNSVNAKIDLAKIYLVSGDNSKAYELIEEVLTAQPDNASAIALRGVFHLKNNTITAARTDSQESIDIDKSNLTAITLLSSINVKDHESDNAIKHIEGILRSTDISKRMSKELQLMLIALYSHTQKTDSVIKLYKNLIEQYPDNNAYVYRLAILYANNDNVDEAQTLLLSNIETNDEKIAYVSFLDQYKSSEEATEILQEYSNDGNGKLNLALGRRFLKLGEKDLAESILQELSKQIDQPEYLEAKNELALLSFKNGDVDTVERLLGEVLSEQPSNLRALIMRGTLSVSQRDAPAAIADFRTVLRDQPNNIYAVRQLSVAYILNDQKDLAKELLQKAVQIDSNDKHLGLLYARLQGEEQNFDSAIDIVNQLLSDDQNDIETIKTLFDLQIANKDYVGAKQTAESMKSVMSDNPLGYYLSGVLLQNEENTTGAEQQYLTALEKQPRANEPLSGLIRLYMSQQEHKKAISYLENIINKDPEYLVPYNLLGEIALSIKDYPLAVDSFESAIKINDQWWIPYRGLSLTYLAQGEREKAINILEHGFNLGAGIERLGIELALIYYQQGERQKSIDTYERIIEKVPNSIISKNNLAMILVDDNATTDNIQSALKYVKELESINEAASLDTVGWVHYNSGNVEQAIEFLEKAVSLAPNAAELHYHLGMAYSSDGGNIEKAKEHLLIATESEQNFTGKEKAVTKLKQL